MVKYTLIFELLKSRDATKQRGEFYTDFSLPFNRFFQWKFISSSNLLKACLFINVCIYKTMINMFINSRCAFLSKKSRIWYLGFTPYYSQYAGMFCLKYLYSIFYIPILFNSLSNLRVSGIICIHIYNFKQEVFLQQYYTVGNCRLCSARLLNSFF